MYGDKVLRNKEYNENDEGVYRDADKEKKLEKRNARKEYNENDESLISLCRHGAEIEKERPKE